MGYDPKKYKKLFPLGLFEFENKPIQTWFDSHKLFAKNKIPQKHEMETLLSGLRVEKGHIKQKNGFSNFMIFEIDLSLRKLAVEFFGSDMLYPLEAFKKLPNPKLLTNAGYFYLTDDESKDPFHPPKVRTGNLVIEKENLVNLPILDRGSVIIFKNGLIDICFLRAKGELILNGNKRFDWIGSKTKLQKNQSFVVYNSSNIEISIVNDPVMGPSRRAVKTLINPRKGFFLAVCRRCEKSFLVEEVVYKKVVINDKDMVLEIPKRVKVSTGDEIKILSVDGIDIEEVANAISTGPLIFKSYTKTKKQVEKEFSIPDMANPVNPHEENKNLARGCLVKLKNKNFCYILVDGIPQAGDIFPGLTLKEFNEFIVRKYGNFESAIATDPSSSVKAVFKSGKKIVVFGNDHYLAHKKDKNGNINFWPDGKMGRKLNSALVVY